MEKKPFWIPLMVSVGTLSILYLIGYLFHIEFLKWFQFTATSTGGFTFSGSLNPIIIGLLVGYITDLMCKYKQKVNSHFV